MDKKTIKGNATRVVSLGLLAATATGMSQAVLPMDTDVANADVKSEATALSGAVELSGPGSSKEYKDEVNGKYWYDKSGQFIATIDGAQYNGIEISVNGELIYSVQEIAKEKTNFGLDINGDSTIRIVTGQFDDYGNFTPVNVTNFEVGIDEDDPEATGTIKGDHEERDGKTYATKDTEFKVDAKDEGSGIKDIFFQKKVESGWKDEPEGDTLKNKEGNFRVQVEDNLGHVTTYSFEELFGTSGKISIEETGQKSNITATVDGDKITDKWLPGRTEDDKRKSHKVVVKIKPSSGIHLGDSVTVNGQDPKAKISTNDEGLTTYTFDIKNVDRADNGEYKIEAESRYLFGETTNEEFTVKADYGLPEILNSKLSGDYTIDDGKIYVNGEAYYNGTVKDIESGVKAVKVYRTPASNDGREEVKVIRTGDNIRFKLEKGNGYYIEVTDNVGNLLHKNLEDLDLGGKDVIEDDDDPVITETDKEKPDYTSSEKKEWFKKPFTMDFTVTDDNMKSVRIDVNGEVSTPEIREDDKYHVNLASHDPVDGHKYEVNIHATDKAGNESDFTREVYVDSDAPEDVKATLEGSYKDRSFGVFSQEDLILHAKANDNSGAGVKGYRLLDAKTKKVLEDSKNGNIKLTDGAYLLVAYDYLGNETKPVELRELLDTRSNEFHVDSVDPKIDVDSKKPIYKNWYDGDVSYTAKFTDNTALYNGVARINGEKVAEFNSNKIEKSRELTFNTKQVKPDASGAYDVQVEGIDAAGNKVKWNETIRIDDTDPEIKSFTFTEPGFKEGESITKSDDYGYYFKGATSVNIKVEDKGASSGVKEVVYVLRNGNGGVTKKGTATVNGSTARVQIPAHFKGYIDAYAIDNVNNEGETVHPSGVITEDRNWYVNTTDIDINMKDPGHKDHDNQYLYNDDTVASVPIAQGVSGIREIEWGIGGNTLGKATVDKNGQLSGGSFGVTQRDKNLVLKADGSLPINGNENNMKVWVKVMDRAGYTSDVDETVSIDKDAPVIDVSYNDTNKSGYYNKDRVANISIKERNFDPKDVELSGKYGTLGSWHQNGDTWTNSITFSEEKEYEWGLEYTDMAGNKGDGYSSEKFTVDKTAPKLSVDFDNNSSNNGNFYKKGRTATIEVIDRNFDQARVDYRGDGKLSGWSHNGDRHTARVSFQDDGEYKFAVDVTDKADNKSNTHTEDKFIVDTTKPKLKIEGVKQGTSYKKDVGVKVISEDKYIDTKASKVSLVGRERGAVKLDGHFNEKTGVFEIENFPKNKKMDDLYKLQANIVDRAGNSEKKEVDFSVNRFGSNFDFLNKDFKGKFYQKLPSNVVMEQDSVDQMDMDGFSVTVLKNGSEMEIPKDSWTVTESGGKKDRWKYKVEVDKELFGDDGKYQVQTFSKAKDGTKESSMDQEYSFGIDATDPEIYISGVEDGKTYTVLDKEATIEVRDLSGVDQLGVSINGKEVDYKEENGVYRINLPVNSEVQSMQVGVKDKAGNTNTESVNDYFLTSSKWEALLHSIWFQLMMLVLLLALFAGAVIVGKRTYDRRQERKRMEENRARAIAASTSGGLSSEGELLAGEGAAGGVASLVGEDPEFDQEQMADPNAAAAAEDDIETDVVGEGDQTTDMIDESDESTSDFDRKDGES